jgi:hypothetical protein
MSYVKYISDEKIYKPNDIDNEHDNVNNDVNDNVNNNINNDNVNNDVKNDNVNNDVNNNIDLEANITDILLKMAKIIKLFDNKNQVTGSWVVIFLTLLILNTLIFGFINLKQDSEYEYLYGINGAYTFNVYYVMNIILYTVFFIIHLFLISAHLSYTIDNMHFIKYLIINYRQIRYNIIVTKIIFLIALLILVFINGDESDNVNCNGNGNDNIILSIPLYYNLIIIETIISMLLIIVIHNVIIINKFLSF